MNKTASASLRRLLTVTEVMSVLGMSESSVRRLIADGELAAYRFSRGTIRVDLADVDAFLEAARLRASATGGEPR